MPPDSIWERKATCVGEARGSWPRGNHTFSPGQNMMKTKQVHTDPHGRLLSITHRQSHKGGVIMIPVKQSSRFSEEVILQSLPRLCLIFLSRQSWSL